MSAYGEFQARLIGDVTEAEKAPGYFARLLERARPEYQRQRALAMRHLKSLEYRGRPHKITVTEAAWVTDLAELRKNILMCWRCDAKFEPAHKSYGYFRDTRWRTLHGGVMGVCDGCRDNMGGLLQLYVHESFIGRGPGQSYVPL